jgi:dynactin complex subunit
MSYGPGAIRCIIKLGMEKPTIDKNRIREQLKNKRERLFEEYYKNPMNTRLAIEIKLIDDQVAELTAQLVQQTKTEDRS